jgi:hypothetical protein
VLNSDLDSLLPSRHFAWCCQYCARQTCSSVGASFSQPAHLSLCHTASSSHLTCLTLLSHLPALVLKSRHCTPSSHMPSVILLHYPEAWSLLASNTNTLTFLLPHCMLLSPYSHPPLSLSSRLPHATSTSPHALLYPLTCPPLSTRITLVARLLTRTLPHPLAMPDLRMPS